MDRTTTNKTNSRQFSTKEIVLQANLQDDQQNIQSLQERLLELECQQDRQQGNLTILM